MIDLSKLKQAAEAMALSKTQPFDGHRTARIRYEYELAVHPEKIIELIARLEAAERNAKRYLFLRQGGDSRLCVFGSEGTAAFKICDEVLDQMVDARMAIDPDPRATDKKKMQQAIEKYGMKPGREWMPHSDGSYSPMDKSDIERIRNDDFLRRRKP